MATTGPDDELQLGDYLAILRRRWIWVLLPMLLVVALAALLTVQQPLQYTAKASVILDQSAAQDAVLGNGSVNSANRDLANEINIAYSDEVQTAVEERLGETTEIGVERDPESDVLYFSAVGNSAEDAATIANTWAEVFVTTKQKQASASITAAIAAFEQDLADRRAERQTLREPLDRLEDRLANATTEESRDAIQADLTRMASDLEVELDLLDNELANLSSTITDLQVAAQLARNGTARINERAFPAVSPSNAPLSRNLVLGAVIGLIAGIGVALLIDNLDRSVKTAEDVTSVGVPVLGTIPRPSKDLPLRQLPLATMNHTGSKVADGYQKVRTAVEFALLGRKIKSLLITSANASEGKTSTSCNLAWAMSAVDHRVVLADVDFRRPRIHMVFGCDAEPGLSDNVLHGTPLNQLALRVDDDHSNMVIIPTGARPPSPGDFVASPAFGDLVQNLESEADLVILDSPPVLPVSDSLSIARHVDAVIVVARSGETTKQELAQTVENLRQVGADVLGVCLVGADTESNAYNYRYQNIDGPARRRFGKSRKSNDAYSNGSGGRDSDRISLGL